MGQAPGRPQKETVLLIDTPGAGWEPVQGGRATDLAASLQQAGAKAIVAVTAPNQGGIWTDVVGGIEVIRLGFPDPPRPRAFDPFDPAPLPENLFIRHWERIAFGRSVKILLSWTGRVVGPLRHGLSGQDLLLWGIVADWSDWSSLPKMPKRAPRGEPARIQRLLVLPAAGDPPTPSSPAPDAPEIERVDSSALASRVLNALETLP